MAMQAASALLRLSICFVLIIYVTSNSPDPIPDAVVVANQASLILRKTHYSLVYAVYLDDGYLREQELRYLISSLKVTSLLCNSAKGAHVQSPSHLLNLPRTELP